MKGIVIIVIVAAIVVLGFIVRMSRENTEEESRNGQLNLVAADQDEGADATVPVITAAASAPSSAPSFTAADFLSATGQNPYNEDGVLVDNFTDGNVAALFEHYKQKKQAYDQGWQPGMAVPSY